MVLPDAILGSLLEPAVWTGAVQHEGLCCEQTFSVECIRLIFCFFGRNMSVVRENGVMPLVTNGH